ncbi:MAG: DUF418 domain-containing protein [Phycisphaerales bacterium]
MSDGNETIAPTTPTEAPMDAPHPPPSIPTHGAPVRQAERIQSLDVMRGVALLGILVMNISAFSMVAAAYENPALMFDLSGANQVFFVFAQLFFNLKMMAIFSMLFGAGVVLMTTRNEAKGVWPVGLHYRRMFMLLLIGLAHAYLFWFGDILVAYALCGMVVFWGRNWRPVTLFAVAAFLLFIPSAILFSLQFAPEEVLAEIRAQAHPPAEDVAAEVAAYRGSFIDALMFRAPFTFAIQIFYFFIWGVWRISGLMLLGMGLYKLGVFSAKRLTRFYLGMVVAGALIGLPLVAYGVWDKFATDFEPIRAMAVSSQFNYWGSLLVAFGWIGAVMLIFRAGVLGWLRRALAAVGQMALTNYLAHTLICTTIFYGYGFGLFGKVEPAQQALIVVAIWVVQLIVSPWWMSRFRFGPFEWLWRVMTYGEWQSMRRLTPALAPSPA